MNLIVTPPPLLCYQIKVNNEQQNRPACVCVCVLKSREQSQSVVRLHTETHKLIFFWTTTV